MPENKAEKSAGKEGIASPEKPIESIPATTEPKDESLSEKEPPPGFGKDWRMGDTFKGETVYHPESDPRLSIGNRILAYLESRKSAEFIRLNDFLKSLYPLPKPGKPAGFENVQNMRFLRMALRQLKDDGKVVFANDSFERLGKHYYNGSAPETKYHNVLSVPIEAKITQ